MLLDYARPTPAKRKLGLSFITGVASLGFGAMAVWCVVHAVHVVSELSEMHGLICGTCYDEIVAALGMPLERTISLGVLSGGFALVAGVQAIRFANGALSGGRAVVDGQ